MSQLFSGAFMALLSLFGLGLAAQARDVPFAIFGWGLCIFGIVVVFALIHRATEPAPRD
ncbi:MAG: hypothetical protein R3C70_12885 [Geminicoccaceae bacterium]|nr:hypothetical protein [Geminicoccaceae bacterium]